MRILLEECRPTRELFSHALNSHYLIPEHCTLLNDALAPFSHDITYLTDGLDRAHYKGSVIANPPMMERRRTALFGNRSAKPSRQQSER